MITEYLKYEKSENEREMGQANRQLSNLKNSSKWKTNLLKEFSSFLSFLKKMAPPIFLKYWIFIALMLIYNYCLKNVTKKMRFKIFLGQFYPLQ